MVIFVSPMLYQNAKMLIANTPLKQNDKKTESMKHAGAHVPFYPWITNMPKVCLCSMDRTEHGHRLHDPYQPLP